MLGLAVGASLSGCGGSVAPGSTPVANAYRFLPLVASGGALPRGETVLPRPGEGILPFNGAVLCNDRRHVWFHAVDANGRLGVYRVDYDPDGTTSEPTALLVQGDILADGSQVDAISCGALNNSDDSAFVVADAEGTQTLQLSHEGERFQRLLTPFEQLSSEARLFGDLHGDLALTDQGDLLFCCDFLEADGYARGEGLFVLPRGSKSEARKVLFKDQLLPGTSSAIRGIGLFDLGADGSYLVHGSAAPVEAQTSPDGLTQTYLLSGRIGETPELLIAHPSLGARGVLAGSVNMGPRLGSRGNGAIVQNTPDQTALWVNGEKLLLADLASGGALSPQGSTILSFFPPVFGPDGLIFIQIFTTNGFELLVTQGEAFATILASGDRVGDKVVDMLLFGALPRCVNAHGELVTAAYFTDGTSAVLVGLPV